METFRISTRNNINAEIKQAETVIKRNKDTIDRLRNSQTDIQFNKKQIEKLTVTLKEYEDKVELLKKKYVDVGLGLHDNEFLKDKVESQTKLKKDTEKQTKKNEEKEQKKINDKEFLDNEYKLRRYEGPSESHLKKETDRFNKIIDSIPSFILDNLKNMPSNKGYIWRGVHCYGELPPESKNIIIFEKCKNGSMKIYENINDNVYIYEKIGKGPKKLLETVSRTSFTAKEIERVISSLGF
jgi:hypothetical protein